MTRFRTAGFVVAALLLGTFTSSSISGCGDSAGSTKPGELSDEDLLSTSPDSPVLPDTVSPENSKPTDDSTIDDRPGASENSDEADIPQEVPNGSDDTDSSTTPDEPETETDDPPPASVTAAEKPTADNPAADNPTADTPPAPATLKTAAEGPAIDKNANAKLGTGDWLQFGGSSYRNNAPPAENIPTEWVVGGFERRTNQWIPDNAENIKWVAQIGNQTYGSPVIAEDRIFVGTNNGAGYLPRYPSKVDLGCLLCFDETDGSFLWQASSEKLPTGSVHDWPQQGICCVPLVEGNRLWYVTSRGEVVCLDTEGFYDSEDDGPVQNEQGRMLNIVRIDDPEVNPVAPIVAELNAGTISEDLRQRLSGAGVEVPETPELNVVKADAQWSLLATINGAQCECRLQLDEISLSVFTTIQVEDQQEADTVWKFDMMGELGVSQHNMCSCSVTAVGDVLFVNTSNGVDETEEQVAVPEAPSFIALEKSTGKLIWSDNSPGANIFHGQWSSPAAGVIHGVPQVIFASGDGWVYSFQADRGEDGRPKLLWKFDTNPKESKWIDGGGGDRTNIIATPVIYDGLVYVVGGHDPEFGVGKTRLWCIDASKRGDVSAELAVMASDHSKILPPRRVQAVVAEQGEAAIDNPNSAVVWMYDGVDKNEDGEFDFEEEMHCSCGGVTIKDNLLFIADFAGLVHCLDAKTGKLHWNFDTMGNVWSSPLIVDNHAFIANEDGVVAIFDLTTEAHDPIFEQDMADSVYSSPTVANGVLYIATRSHLVAIQAQ